MKFNFITLILILNTFLLSADNLYMKYEKMSPEYIKRDLIDRFDKIDDGNGVKQSLNKKTGVISLTFSFKDETLTKQLFAMDRIERNICMSPRSKLLLTKDFKYLIKHIDINLETNYIKLLNKEYCQIHFKIRY